jgi:hypothetical protein
MISAGMSNLICPSSPAKFNYQIGLLEMLRRYLSIYRTFVLYWKLDYRIPETAIVAYLKKIGYEI